MSIVRIGLAENKRFASGYDAIFNKKAGTAADAPVEPPAAAAAPPDDGAGRPDGGSGPSRRDDRPPQQPGVA